MADPGSRRRTLLIVRLREVEHREAAAALVAVQDQAQRAHNLATRTGLLAAEFSVRRDAGDGQALSSQFGMTSQTHCLQVQAQQAATGITADVDRCITHERRARKRLDLARDRVAALRATELIDTNNSSEAFGRSRLRLARNVKRG